MATQRQTFSVREYQESDAPSLAQLFYSSVRELGRRAYSEEQVIAWAPEPRDPALFHAKAADGRTTLVAINWLGEPIAYGDLEGDGHIDNLYCRPDLSGHGVASGLLCSLLSTAASAGIPRLFTEASELARGAFERKGFTIMERREFILRGVNIHNYAMERLLG
jgi:putative acetyltransferase